MNAVVILIIRILLTLSLYAFLGWAIYILWRELQINKQLISSRRVPIVSITRLDSDDDSNIEYSTMEVIMGREPGVDYVIPNETVSARHARLSYHHNQWWIEDLQSTNGTFLNDERVETPTVIISGDELRCGNANLLVIISSSEA
ncbi:MAG: FHA domain-containing protein [Anaerolineaceae bacterium]|jgi:pSer/pThr/pTyr-binding forkhead associated (FHA) protein